MIMVRKIILTTLLAILLSASKYKEITHSMLDVEITHEQRVKCLVDKDRYELVCAIIEVESNWNHKAISHTGDYGLMQMNKATWSKHYDFNKMLQPEYNILAGNEVLDRCLVAAKGDTTLALIYYNGSKHYPKKIYRKIEQRRQR